MPTDNPEKAYVKKHKINDLLNDLYLSLTKNKPDDPLEYCYSYFEGKLPPQLLLRRKSSAANASDFVTESPNLVAGRDLLGKLMMNASSNINDNSNLLNVPGSQLNISTIPILSTINIIV
jgi:hypothetical protein